MLSTSTGFTAGSIAVKLVDESRDIYLFQSGASFYFWDTASEEATQIVSPTTYDQIVKQMSADVTKVVVKALAPNS